ncbi:MAG: patatin-like phospholipase family protein [Gemmatimonadota bacterium]
MTLGWRSFFLIVGMVRVLPAQECRPMRTALVLSGGGAKGLAHLGVLAALDSLGTRPDLIVGTSVGAIVGALYASGYSARQIDSLAHGLPIAEIVRPFRSPAPHAWDRRLPILFLVKGRNGFEFQTGVVDETQPNARLNAALLRGNLLARGRFDRLPIPFLAVATDLRDRRTVVMSDGDLARAVRASSAIPLIFPPVILGNAVLVDGGLSANIPILEARAAGAERVIVSDVSEHATDSLDVESPLALADQLLGFLFQQPPAPLERDDIMIRPAVQQFRSLDFSPETVAEVLRRGRRAADTTMAKARCLLPRPPLEVPKVPATLAGWTVTGSPADSTLVTRILRLAAPERIDFTRLQDRLTGVADAEALRGIWLNPTGTADSVRFRIEPIRAPNTVGGAGAAYDNELGGRVWAGLFDRRVFGTTLESSALLSLGRLERELYGTVLWHFDAGWSRLTPMTTVRLRAEDVRTFDDDGRLLGTVPTTDARLSSGVEIRAWKAWRVRFGADAFLWGGRGIRGDGAVGGSLRVERQWTAGPQMLSEAIVTGGFQSVRMTVSWPMVHHAWWAEPGIRAAIGHDLPLQWTFPLGGDDGFPGLHIGALRGSREAEGLVRFGRAIKGAIEIRAMVAAGRAWTPGAPGNDWVGGARLGLGADTPVGPIDVAYGVATNGRGALFLRLGQWF